MAWDQLQFYQNGNCKESGSALIQSALSQLKTMVAKGCVVLGDPNFYAEFGFKAVPELILENVPAEYFSSFIF